MANSGSFAVSVKLIDLASAPLVKINQSIANVEKTASRAARQGGLYEARDALSKMRREAGAVADKMGQLFTPLGGLAAAGSLAGLASLAERFGNVGNEVGRTSNLFGVGTKDLQNWRGAMRLAGGSAEEATSLIGKIGRQLYLARAGLNPNVVLGAQQFGLNIAKGDLPFILDMADKLKGLSAQQRRQFAEVFGIDEASLALLSQGREAIERLIKESERHGYLNGEQLHQAAALHQAYVGLTQSVESMGLAVGGQIGTWLTPMAKGWSDWLDQARATPAIVKTIELGVDALAFAMGVTLVGSLIKIWWWANAIWALPLFKFLAARGGGALLGGFGVAGAAAAGAAGIFAPGLTGPAAEVQGGFFDGLRRWINRAITGAAPGQENLPGGPARGFGARGEYGVGTAAEMDPMAPAGAAPITEGITTVTSPSGRKFRVAARFAANFQGFINDYEKAGGVIGPASGGLSERPGNASYHPLGRAIDIDQTGRNIRSGGHLPEEIENTLAEKWGLYPGSLFSNPDAGHFEVRNARAAGEALGRQQEARRAAEPIGPPNDAGADADTTHHVHVILPASPLPSNDTQTDGPSSTPIRTQRAMDGVF